MHIDTIEDFVKSGTGQNQLVDAVKQQQDLAYFTQSVIQEELTNEYLNAWTERKYATNDMFLNYVKSVFRTDNALVFFKFMRHPLPSAELINSRIKEPLERVFHADDSFINYNVRGEALQDIPELNSKKFDKDVFNALLFKHNNIVVTTVVDTNTPSREIIDIESIVAIESSDSVIHRVAYAAIFNHEKGFMYIDSEQYAFLNDKFEIVASVPHDLEETPADFIAQDPFADDDAVRESMFSYIRGDLEEYVFLKTLLKMTEPNGVIPVVTMLKAKVKKDEKDKKSQGKGEPATVNSMGSQQASLTSEVVSSNNLMQAGTQIKVDGRLKDDGSIDSDIVQNYFNFFHMPVEPLKYVEERIEKIKKEITTSLLGSFSEHDEEAKNRLQVRSSFVSKEDVLRSLSREMSRIVSLSNFKFLALQHGRDNVSTSSFFGSDFFLESQEQLFEIFEKAPNPIERKDILIKTTKNKYRFNESARDKQLLLYHLMPYSADEDFEKALENNLPDFTTKQYQTRFNYWVGSFEAQFGDILLFFEALEGTNSQKILLINNLIINIINSTVTEQKPVDPIN